MDSGLMIYSKDNMTGHRITEQNVQRLLSYLRLFRPDKATREDAEEILQYMKLKYHREAFSNSEALNELLNELEKSKQNTDQ